MARSLSQLYGKVHLQCFRRLPVTAELNHEELAVGNGTVRVVTCLVASPGVFPMDPDGNSTNLPAEIV